MFCVSIITEIGGLRFHDFLEQNLREYPSFGKDMRILAVFLFVHVLDALLHNPNGLVQPVDVRTDAFQFSRRKPFAGILRRLAQRLEVPGPDEERQVVRRPAENLRRFLSSHTRSPSPHYRISRSIHNPVLSARRPLPSSSQLVTIRLILGRAWSVIHPISRRNR